MNNNAQTTSQENEKKELAPGEFVYEFFQPVFESTFNFEFSSAAGIAAPANNAPPQPANVQPPSTPASTPDVSEASIVCSDNSFVSFELPSQEITANTAGVQASQAPVEKTLDRIVTRQVTTDSGAVIFYGRWNIKPHRIQYPDRSVAEFEYDESQKLIRVVDRDGTEWIRITQPDHKNISTWKSSEGQTCDMSMVVIPDGTYQVISAAGVIQTCTINGRIIVWTPFTEGFDLKRTLFAIFRSVDKNKDSTLSKEELDLASRQIWQDADAVQLISMMQSHFDAICASRRHALCRQGSGITIDDILAFDESTKTEQESRCMAPAHVSSLVRSLFDELDISGSGATDINQVRIAYEKRHERDNALRSILETLYEELRSQYEGKNAGFASKANFLTRSDLVQHYKDGYRKEVSGQIKIAGWGSDECWQASETTTRTLYVDPANPLESIRGQAIQQRHSDPEMGIFNAIFESIVVQCPHLIVRMICQIEEGKYKVTFPGDPAKPITVSAPSTSCLAQYLHGSKFGFWMAVIVNAYKQYQSQQAEWSNIDHLQMVDRICKLMSGQSGRWASASEMQLKDLNNYLRDIFRQRRLMIAAGLRHSPRMNGSRFISKSAVCGIVDFDHKNGRITVSDPLRDNNADNFSDPTHRNADGSTTLSLSSFVAAFDQIYVEDWLSHDQILQK